MKYFSFVDQADELDKLAWQHAKILTELGVKEKIHAVCSFVRQLSGLGTVERAASVLGKRAKGKRKVFTEIELARRKQRLVRAREIKAIKHGSQR